jgi:hypothetical protein
MACELHKGFRFKARKLLAGAYGQRNWAQQSCFEQAPAAEDSVKAWRWGAQASWSSPRVSLVLLGRSCVISYAQVQHSRAKSKVQHRYYHELHLCGRDDSKLYRMWAAGKENRAPCAALRAPITSSIGTRWMIRYCSWLRYRTVMYST